MDGDLMTISYIEDPSFRRSFRAGSPPEIAGKDVPFDDFEFAFSSAKSESDPAVQSNADEIFKNGRFLAVNPVFKAADGMDFEQSPSSKGSISKSNSAGSVGLESRRLRLRKIDFGRSRSEGDKPLLAPVSSGDEKMEMSCFFLFRYSRKSAVAKEVDKKRKSQRESRGAVKELDFVSAHRNYYGGGIAGGSRRSFLPYRRELLTGCGLWHSRRNPF